MAFILACPEFNCNSFTNDVVGFLTGQSIPDFIKGQYEVMYDDIATLH